ncbi:MAG TPA: DUF6268 family outer membrane beta-barrel protein [Opitutaceae bacterium]|nr:DUF6268 family outer membrane beta-barrel protein [Opitutaceae bacterium]
MKPILVPILCTSFAVATFAADAPVTVEAEPFQLGLSASVATGLSGNTKLKTGSRGVGEVSTAEFDHAAAYEIKLANGGAVSVGHTLHLSRFELPENNRTVALPKRLQSAQAEFSYSQPCGGRWSAIAALSPGLRWAASDAGSNAFAVSAAAGAIYRQSETFTFMLGLAYDSLARNKVLPGGGLQWTPSERWSVSLGYPKTAITYNASKSLSLSLLAEGVSDTYHVEKDPLPGLAGKPSLADTKLEYNDYRVGIAAEYRFSPRCAISATAGCVVAREFDYFDRHYRLKSDDTAAYGSLALALKF